MTVSYEGDTMTVQGSDNWPDYLPITVKVPRLYPMSGPHLRLTGETTSHPVNHYATIYAITSTWLITEAYYGETGLLLGINDMSLEWGGLFDLCDTWKPKDTCALAKKGGHFSHRKGTSVDIDRCAESVVDPNIIDSDCIKLGYSKGYMWVDRYIIQKVCERRSGRLLPESTIHCEFSN